MAEPHCPRCRSAVIDRASRATLLERLLSVVYIYPFRCQSCLHRFRRMAWGQRYVRTKRTGQSERRQHSRHTVDFWTTLWLESGQRPVRTRNLSVGGMSLETDAPLRPGQHLELELQAAPDESPIRVEVAVVRSVQDGRVGLQFVRVKDDGDERLTKFLAGREATPPTPPALRPPGPTTPRDAS